MILPDWWAESDFRDDDDGGDDGGDDNDGDGDGDDDSGDDDDGGDGDGDDDGDGDGWTWAPPAYPTANSPVDPDDNEATTIERFLTRNKKQIFSIVFVFVQDRKPMEYFRKLSDGKSWGRGNFFWEFPENSVWFKSMIERSGS